MSEKYPYPECEHYVFPTNSIEILAEQLERFEGGKPLRDELSANVYYYKETPFLKALHSYAALNKLALAGSAGDENDIVGDHMTAFFAGETTALHSLLHLERNASKHRILSHDPLSPIHGDDVPHRQQAEIAEELIERLSRWRDVGSEIELNSASDSERDLIVTFAERVYEDIPDSGAYIKSFIDGFLFADGVVKTLKYTRP